MATKKIMSDAVLDLAAGFVRKQQGAWEHEDWEKFLADAEKLGVEMSDETRRNLGNILEAAKFFYGLEPAKKPAARKAPAKKKAAAE